jgi:uncharacterized membrane protein YkvA (DUF1232 family)
MNLNKTPNLPEIPGSQGFFHQLALRIKLFLRMMKDPRISIWLKALPVFSIIYLISPLDLAPLMPLDDAAVLTLAFYLFIELSPKDVVDELMQELKNLQSTGPVSPEKKIEIIEGIMTNKEKAQLDAKEKPEDTNQGN